MRIVYLHGFASGPASSKARFFAEQFRSLGIDISIPDLADGDFEHLTITGQLKVVDREVQGRPVVLMGSSMGGYLAALYAARHREVERLVLLAPAFDFARRWPESLGETAMHEWQATEWRTTYHYGDGHPRQLSYQLIEDGFQYEDYPAVTQPALILHGTRDDVVPAAASKEFAKRGQDRQLVLLDSGHELTDVLDRLWAETAKFLRLDTPVEAPI
jgi:uncharacterized protein